MLYKYEGIKLSWLITTYNSMYDCEHRYALYVQYLNTDLHCGCYLVDASHATGTLIKVNNFRLAKEWQCK